MRVSRAQAEENRRRIIETAGRAFREKGFDGIGINDLMQAAGLTHGGFYGHFKSKQDLAAQACRHSLDANLERFARALTHSPTAPLYGLAEMYLSRRHAQQPEQGCTLAALGGEAARQEPELRRAFDESLERYIALLAPLMPDQGTAEAPREQALATLATLVGALVLARAVEGEALSEAILQAGKRAVVAP